MRVTEQIRLAWNTMGWSTRWVTVVISVMAFVCLFLGINIQAEVYTEKASPCELTVTTLSDTLTSFINSETFSAVKQMEEVIAATYVWTLDSRVEFEEFGTELTLCGVDSSYPDGVWLQGSVFPEDSAMPYLVLNKAAVSSMKDEKNIPLKDAENIAWDVKQVTLLADVETVVRICGVLDDGRDVPLAYLSSEQVKKLRLEAGHESPADTLWLRLVDSGARGTVADAVAGLGLYADIGDEWETDWNNREERSALYVGTGLILLGCSIIVNIFLEKNWRRNETQAYQVLDMMGIPVKQMKKITIIRWGCTYTIGGIIGRIILLFL